jgi:hypothetical protein
MAVVTGIGNILTAIIHGVVNFIGIIVSFLTCGYCGGKSRKRTGTHSTRGHHTTTSRI